MKISGSTREANTLIWEGRTEEIPSILRDIAGHSEDYERPIEVLVLSTIPQGVRVLVSFKEVD